MQTPLSSPWPVKGRVSISRGRKYNFWRYLALFMTMSLLMALVASQIPPAVSHAASNVVPAVTTDDWPTYLHDNYRSGASNDTGLSAANAGQLTKQWGFKTGGGISAGAAIVNGIAYVGSWDGYEYALDAVTGAVKWKANLGQTITPNCIPATIGVNSSATVLNGVVYVGGGDSFWYALDANTGNVLWKVNTGDNSITGGHYNWSSPLIYNGSAYIGIASNCDSPLVQGLLWKVDLQTHQVTKVFDVVPAGQVGGGIWTTPSVDPETNTIYVTTGTQSLTTQTYSQAVVALDAGTLAVKSSWQIPFDQAGIDLDWGTTPVFFKDANGNKRVTAINKDGFVYSLDATDLNKGPVWQQEVAITGSCPPCGNGSVSTSVVANGVIYVSGGNTTIQGKGYQGSVRALDATTGAIKWEHGTSSPVIPALAYANGLVIDGAGPMFEVLNAANGERLYSYKTGGMYAAAAVAHGTIYVGDLFGTVYAFGLPANPPPPPPADPNCPAGWNCQDIGAATPLGNETGANGNWNITAGGAGVAGTADQFRFVSQPANGNMQLTTRVLTRPGAAAGAQAGLMLRQSTDAGSPYYAVFATQNNGLTVQSRAGFNEAPAIAKQLNPVGLPRYLRILRQGDQLSTATSADGVNYTLVPGSTVTVVVPTRALVGVMTSSGVNGTGALATYTPAVVAALGALPPSTPPATACAAGWNCADIGNPALVGDQALNNGVWTLKGAGNDISNYSDQFHYVWKPMTGNSSVSAHITAQTNTSPGAKAGVMLRQTTDSASPYYAAFLTPGHDVLIQYRTNQGQNTTQVEAQLTANNALKVAVPATACIAPKCHSPHAKTPTSQAKKANVKAAAVVAPIYLRVERYSDANNGTVFAAFTSANGTDWTYIAGSTVSFNLNGDLLGGIAVSSANGGVLGNATFDQVAISGVVAPPPTLCPAGWSCADIANSVPTGNQEVNGTTWTVQAGGSDIYALGDQFRFMGQTQPADASISTHIASQDDTDPWAKAGVMLRQSNKAASPYYAALITPGNGLSIQYRLVQGGDTRQISVPTLKAPIYLEVARSGNIYTTYTSTDGVTWTPITGSSLSLNIPGPIIAGLAVTSHTTAALGTVVFENVAVSNTSPIPPTACPAGWHCDDIGNPTILGSQSLSNGTWSIQGGGTDIWNTVDQFHFIWQTEAADTTASVHITKQAYTDPWAKAGVMLRLSNDPGSPYYAAFATPDNGIAIQYRSTQGGTTTQLSTGGTVPVYLRVARFGGTFTAYTSTDGTTWTPVANSSLRLNITVPLQVGVAVTGHSEANIGDITADGLTLTADAPPPPVAACPAGWTCGDVGAPALIGTQALTNGMWTVTGAGADIWGNADQFHYVWQALNADGAVSAHVLDQSYTDPWTRSGVMLRQSTDPAAPYYAAFVTHDYGIAIQYRLTQGGATTQVTVNGKVPVYLKVTRTGNNYTAYSSADGITWAAVAGSTVAINMPGAILVGLVESSHNANVLGTATFDSVNVTGGTPAAKKPAASVAKK
ncbi:hypothetical protein KDA_71920 [Dictyobacter alpinus]|uniref:Pyrrolo-quinoline quinone repeat domain-containing protein n=1 Tax=Dictyobacter alpinus TaxID=2014873 RepID=A0A402BK29_9CHLR|nr:PQQ-binding-like beta-propeller repeat protein [Dictyobacter alpinus]GCE31708.1 hypothetical protein KDA_71920 [Dictyobacter alpinus]